MFDSKQMVSAVRVEFSCCEFVAEFMSEDCDADDENDFEKVQDPSVRNECWLSVVPSENDAEDKDGCEKMKGLFFVKHHSCSCLTDI